MPTNLEIKAPCADLARARDVAKSLSTAYVGVDRQVDTYFVTQRGRLKLRESSLSGGQLVPYLRPDAPGPRRADYVVVPVEDPAALKRLLSELLGVHVVVEKEREIWLHENVRIHLDRVTGLGDFCELEAIYDGSRAAEDGERAKLAHLMERLGIREADLIPTSYEAMLRKKTKEGGRT